MDSSSIEEFNEKGEIILDAFAVNILLNARRLGISVNYEPSPFSLHVSSGAAHLRIDEMYLGILPQRMMGIRDAKIFNFDLSGGWPTSKEFLEIISALSGIPGHSEIFRKWPFEIEYSSEEARRLDHSRALRIPQPLKKMEVRYG